MHSFPLMNCYVCLRCQIKSFLSSWWPQHASFSFTNQQMTFPIKPNVFYLWKDVLYLFLSLLIWMEAGPETCAVLLCLFNSLNSQVPGKGQLRNHGDFALPGFICRQSPTASWAKGLLCYKELGIKNKLRFSSKLALIPQPFQRKSKHCYEVRSVTSMNLLFSTEWAEWLVQLSPSPLSLSEGRWENFHLGREKLVAW